MSPVRDHTKTRVSNGVRPALRKGRRPISVLVTAGPTREKIDPVRFISNYSTGAFGYRIAEEARRRLWRVTLISGPVNIDGPKGVRLIRTESALDMRRAVKSRIDKCDCLIMAAAVSDWRAASASKTKIKRSGNTKTLRLKANPDILKELGKKKNRVLVGFALETENLERNAAKKLKEKNLDLIVANRLAGRSRLFGDNRLDVVIIDKFGGKTRLHHKTKGELAKIILDRVLNIDI